MTKIAWTNELFIPMQVNMTFFARSSCIEYMSIIVTQMVMIFDRFSCAIKTRQSVRSWNSTCFDSVINLTGHICLSFSGWREPFSFHSDFYSSAVSAYRKLAVPSSRILTKFRHGNPRITFVTPFKTRLSARFVFFYRKIGFFSHQLSDARFSLSHNIPFHNMNSICPL